MERTDQRNGTQEGEKPKQGQEHPNENLDRKRQRERKQYLGVFYSCEGKLGGPPVDDERLRKLERDELTEEERQEVFHLIATYAAWASRSDQIHSEEVDRWNTKLD